MRALVLALCVFAPTLAPAQTAPQTAVPPPRPQKALTPEQEAYKKAIDDFGEQSTKLEAAAKAAFDAEIAREKADLCPNAANTLELNECILHEMALTNANYKAYIHAVRAMLALPEPQIPDMSGPATGPTGLMSTPATDTAAFDKAESAWQAFAAAECSAVDTHWRGGTIVNFEIGQCHIRLARARMDELDSVYGPDHL